MVEERTMWCVLVLIFSLLRESSSTAIPFFIDPTETNWTDAASNCEMVEPGDVLNVTGSSVKKLPNLAWIKATVSFTQWTLYLGCVIFKPQTQSYYSTHSFESKHPFLYCMTKCSSSQYFGIKDTRCACFKNTIVQPPTSSKEAVRACNPISCRLDNTALCGNANDRELAIYEKVDLNIRGIDNCLSATGSNSVALKTTPCNEELPYHCRNGEEIRSGNWTMVNKKCNSPYTINTTKPGWTAYTRRWTNKRVTEENPEYCLVAKVNPDGRMDEHIRKCNVNFPTLCKLTENQESSDQPNDTTDVPLISIAIGLSVVLIIVVGIIIVICVRTRRQSIKIDNREAHEKADVYAVVEKDHSNYRQVNESLLNCTSSSNNVNVSRMNSTSGEINESLMNSLQTEDVYDHTDHTLRPQIHEESNYDTMQSTSIEFEECENVYNTTNEGMTKGIIVENDSEYSHLGTTDG